MRTSILLSAIFLGYAAAVPTPQAAAAQCFDAGDCILSVGNPAIPPLPEISLHQRSWTNTICREAATARSPQGSSSGKLNQARTSGLYQDEESRLSEPSTLTYHFYWAPPLTLTFSPSLLEKEIFPLTKPLAHKKTEPATSPPLPVAQPPPLPRPPPQPPLRPPGARQPILLLDFWAEAPRRPEVARRMLWPGSSRSPRACSREDRI